MNTTPLRRPLGSLKKALRQTRQQRLLPQVRFLASAVQKHQQPSSTSLPEPSYHRIQDYKRNRTRTAFAVYPSQSPPTSSASAAAAVEAGGEAAAASVVVAPPSNPCKPYDEQQIARMDPTGARTALFDRNRRDSVKVGDVLMVTTRRAAEPFAGVLISIRRRGIETAILLRGQLTRVGVEMWFKIYSRGVVGIDIVQRRPKRARRARLTYMRKPRHDRGSVEKLVIDWRRSRTVVRTKTGTAAAKAAPKTKF